ncbi:MAG: DNA methyltransferase, partial [Planctomycetes bacterium]|nr:DNA methyltransferase [Planctomycetota bacterium]
GIRRDWPRIPLPGSRKALEASVALGRQVAALLDTEAEASGVTAGQVEPIFQAIGALAKVGGGALNPDAGDLSVTAGWGHAGKGGVTMPGKGRIVQRPYNMAELDAIADAAKVRGLSPKQALALLGSDTRDVYLNDKAYWRNVPANVWEYFIGGYQVIKKWLSYREHKLLGRALSADEAREVTGTARRLAAIVLLQPDLDENYRRVAASVYAWPSAK